MAQNFVELNGNRYDAESGAFLGKADEKPDAAKVHIAKPAETAPQHHAVPRQPHHIAARHPQHANTLRRDAVKRPDTSQKIAIKIHVPAKLGQHQPDVLRVQPKLSSQAVDPDRASRALEVPHSPKIERFRPVQPQHHGAHIASIPVQPEPNQHHASHAAQSPQRQPDIFEQAIARATSHEQPAPNQHAAQKPKHGRRHHQHVMRMAASAAVLVLLGGFIFWQNRVSVEMQLAAARSGVAAAMPSYKPGGFALYQLHYTSGSVTLGFRAPGNKAYNVVQQTSNWDSQTLLENYVATSGQTYSTYLSSGRTVYIYGNNATWVSGGIWYQINDDGSLNKDQLINLANSM